MKKGEIILIVDDNMNFVDRIIGMLTDIAGIEDIQVARDFDEARILLALENPGTVLLDINLPGKNGIELLKLIKKNSPECEIVMITNHADEYYRRQCHELGAKHFLDKSNDFAMVPAIVRQKVAIKSL